jgi:hypothetical protein
MDAMPESTKHVGKKMKTRQSHPLRGENTKFISRFIDYSIDDETVE